MSVVGLIKLLELFVDRGLSFEFVGGSGCSHNISGKLINVIKSAVYKSIQTMNQPI